MEAAKVIQLHTDPHAASRRYAQEHGLERKGGIPDPVWDACEVVLGYGPLTETEIRLWGRLVTSLRRAGATTETIEAVAANYRKAWPNVDLTLTALEKHYSHFLRLETKRKSRSLPCPECEIGGGRHAIGCPLAR